MSKQPINSTAGEIKSDTLQLAAHLPATSQRLEILSAALGRLDVDLTPELRQQFAEELAAMAFNVLLAADNLSIRAGMDADAVRFTGKAEPAPVVN